MDGRGAQYRRAVGFRRCRLEPERRFERGERVAGGRLGELHIIERQLVRTLNVAGGWNTSASNGRNPTVTLNTTLNEGGALSNQRTDRLLIAGDANGSTTLNVRAQGAGAFTSTSVTPGANEGISLVQVGGNASAQSFELQNGYVAVGPYQYHLSAFAPGASNAEQRLVAGSGDAYGTIV